MDKIFLSNTFRKKYFMDKLVLKQEVLDAYDGYVKAFITGEIKR